MIFNFDFRPLLCPLMHCSKTLPVCAMGCVCVCVCLDGKNNFPEKLRYDINVHNIHSKSILQ